MAGEGACKPGVRRPCAIKTQKQGNEGVRDQPIDKRTAGPGGRVGSNGVPSVKFSWRSRRGPNLAVDLIPDVGCRLGSSDR